ncbi:MAG: hypothetical protein GXP45_07045 [bacterium]|nr:hypothetical protein [bacterium]
MEFPKKYKIENEKKIFQSRKDDDIYHNDKQDILWSSMPLSLGNQLHLGQVFSYVLQDIIVRYREKQ